MKRWSIVEKIKLKKFHCNSHECIEHWYHCAWDLVSVWQSHSNSIIFIYINASYKQIMYTNLNLILQFTEEYLQVSPVWCHWDLDKGHWKWYDWIRFNKCITLLFEAQHWSHGVKENHSIRVHHGQPDWSLCTGICMACVEVKKPTETCRLVPFRD